MNENETNNKFDFVFFVKKTITLKKLDTLIKEIREHFENVEYVDFLGLRKTAYTINGENEAYCFSIIHHTAQEKTGKVILKLKENTNILKFMNCQMY